MNTNAYLDELEAQSIWIIREACWQYKGNVAILWSMGKDSTTLVHLARKAFLENMPIPVVHIDTTLKFKEIYEFRSRLAKEWGLNLIVAKNEGALAKQVSPNRGRFECCNALKTEALKQAITKHNFKALMVAIRRDEHAIRAKERFFSARNENFQWEYQNQPAELWAQYYKAVSNEDAHARIHPLLGWREIDVWRYIKRENLPVVDLYLAKGGKRYRSIGCACCCQPVESHANTINKIIKELETTRVAERSGRAQDKEKEYMMQKLRSLGYM